MKYVRTIDTRLMPWLPLAAALMSAARFLGGCSDDPEPAAEGASDAGLADAARDSTTVDLDGGGRTCTLSSDLEALVACAPSAPPEGVAFIAKVREACGGCSTTAKRCTVLVDPEARTIRLSLDGETCTGETCDTLCRRDDFDCEVIGLQAGRYTLRYGAGGAKMLSVDVADAGTNTSCTLPVVSP